MYISQTGTENLIRSIADDLQKLNTPQKTRQLTKAVPSHAITIKRLVAGYIEILLRVSVLMRLNCVVPNDTHAGVREWLGN